MSGLRDLASAVSLLTVIPTGGGAPSPHSTAWFPWVGWILGVPAALLAWSLATLRPGIASALLTPVLVLALWLVLTRGLHWDGLMDVADGLGPLTAEDRTRAARDPRAGAFGVLAAVLGGLAFTAAGAGIASSGVFWPWLAAPVLGRFSSAIAAWTLPPARPEGLGRSASGRPTSLAVATALLALAPFAILRAAPATLGWSLFAGLAVGLVAPRFLAARFGGVNGDVLGATVVLSEVAVVVTAALA